MPALAIILVIVGLVLLFLGVFVEAVKFLLWIGVIILIVGVVVALLRFLRRKV
jgi:membrane protein implicated in regulation of membrane protease activity